jgi:hypothetical protein
MKKIEKAEELKEEETELDDSLRGVFRMAKREREALLLASMARKATLYEEWVDALNLTDEEKKIVKGKAVMEKMLEMIVREVTEVKKLNDIFGWRRAMKSQNLDNDRTQGWFYDKERRSIMYGHLGWV